jgi:hypothetical protein
VHELALLLLDFHVHPGGSWTNDQVNVAVCNSFSDSTYEVNTLSIPQANSFYVGA